MNGNPFLQPDSPGPAASRSRSIVRQKYVASQPSQDYFEPNDENVHGDFSEFEGKKKEGISVYLKVNIRLNLFFFWFLIISCIEGNS
jgi:hypothetical protein